MANKHRGEYEAEIGGQKYVLRLGLSEIAEFEEIFGCSFLELASGALASGRTNQVLDAVACAAKAGGREIEREKLEEAAIVEGIARMIFHLKSLITIAFYGTRNVDRETEPNPPKAATGRKKSRGAAGRKSGSASSD